MPPLPETAARSLETAPPLPPALVGPGLEFPAPRPIAFDRGYDRAFWLTYAANSLLMVVVALLFRYGDFVTSLGGSALDLGWIVGAGMIGSLIMRYAQAAGIDRHGPRVIWLCSLALCVASLLGHLAVTHIGPGLYLLRIAFTVSLAGSFGASITSISRELTLARMAEVVGVLGTSGFLAMALGAILGDQIIGRGVDKSAGCTRMFMIAAALATASLALAAMATHGEPKPRPRRRPPLLWLLNRYHPGAAILIVDVAMGASQSLPGVFLANFAESRGIGGISSFFVVYALTAFGARIVTRRFPSRYGARPMIYLGIASVVISFACYPLALNSWLLMIPGFFGGFAHAVLYPAVLATGTTAFPNRYRGLGITLMLSALDLGTLIGSPLAGAMLTYSPRAGLSPYPTMFLAIAALIAAVGIYYALVDRPSGSEPSRGREG